MRHLITQRGLQLHVNEIAADQGADVARTAISEKEQLMFFSVRLSALHGRVIKFKLLNMYIFIYTYVHTDMPEGLEQGFGVY